MKNKFFILAAGLIVVTIYSAQASDIRNSNKQQYKSSSYNRDTQNQEKSSFQFDRSKVTLGGNFGLGFSDGTTIINIAPQIGYFFTPKINAGAGISYTYYKYDNDLFKDKYNYFGINVFGRFYPIQYIVIHAQPEINYLHRSVGGNGSSEFVPSFIVGAGVNFNSVTLMLQYDVVQNKYSPYGNNIFYSVGFSF